MNNKACLPSVRLQEVCLHHPAALHGALQRLHPEHRGAGQHAAAQEPGRQHQQYAAFSTDITHVLEYGEVESSILIG